MVGRLGPGDNVAGIFDLTTDLTTNPAMPVYPITASLQRFWFSTWKPDGTRLFTQEWDNTRNWFNLIDTKNGAVVPPVSGPLPRDGTHPCWAPDGSAVVYASETNDWGGNLTVANLSLLAVTGPDSFASPVIVHTASSIGGSSVDDYPTWSPDSKWIAFHNGTDARSDDQRPGALYLIHPDGSGLVRLDNATGGPDPHNVYFPNFSPFDAGGYFWLTFISERPYGNSSVGTAAAPHQQLWVSAIKDKPRPGEDPSGVPYWIAGQSTSAKNISAYWAPKACRVDTSDCTVGSDCCSGVCLMGKCGAPTNHCLMQDQSCGGSGCCSGLQCNPMTHLCESSIG
jgi:hypothetical protein